METLTTYRKRSLTEDVQAVQFVAPADDQEGNRKALIALGIPVVRAEGYGEENYDLLLHIAKSEGTGTVHPGDWIVQERDGSGWYPVAADVFADSYGPLDEEATAGGDGVVEAELGRLRRELTNADTALDTRADEVERLTRELAEAEQRFDDARLIATAVWTDDLVRDRTGAVEEEHRNDEAGRPAGGESIGTGITITWQNGPLVVDGERVKPTGAFVENVIDAAIGRLEYYQASQFACPENADALDHLYGALAACHRRTAAREDQGVEGTHETHTS
jgi:hypothetical protein